MKSLSKKSYLINLLLFLTTFGIAQNPIEKEGWTLTFNDEFNDTVLDKTKWQTSFYWGGRNYENDIVYYGENQFEFSDSSLLIKAEKKEEKSGIPYTSGLIDCHFSFKQQYGYFEIRSKNPTGTGFWPAFWLVSTEQWPPEIDIFEFYTSHPNNWSTSQHWKTKRGKNKRQTKNYKIDDDASEGFQTYAVEWTPKKIIWYYNNKKFRTARRGVKTMNFPMHIIISNAVSEMKEMNLEEAIFPNYFEIDYVRVYQRNE
ncbi:MAG: glycoside hydrolase family 16 protein [Vicingaceae bacterium]|nr:glycoside hydrolase family 16 protein [Vicingaceae bacterium]